MYKEVFTSLYIVEFFLEINLTKSIKDSQSNFYNALNLKQVR